MKNRRTSILALILTLICLVTLAGMEWANYSLAKNKIGGGDFLVHWTAIRSLATEGVSPYSEIVDRRISSALVNKSTTNGLDRFSSPLFSGLFVLPFALIADFTLAYSLWLLTLEVCLAFIVLSSIRLSGWKPGWKGMLFFWLYCLASVYSFAALAFGSLVIFTTLLLVLCFQSLRNQRDELGGILMALAFIQPEVVCLVGVYAVLWAISKRRWSFIVWFFGGLILLSFLGILIIPQWPIQYVQFLWHWANMDLVQTPGQVFSIWWPGLGKQMGWGLAILLGLMLGGEWLASLSKELEWFLWTVCLTIVFSQWIGIPTSISNGVLLIFPLSLIFANWQARIGKQSIWLIGGSLIILLLALWFIAWYFLNEEINANAFYFFNFPLTLITAVGLYWVRWWAIYPTKMPMDEYTLPGRS